MPATYPKEPQKLPRGVVRWDLPFDKKVAGGPLCVPVECECGARRLVAVGDLRKKNRDPSGICVKCHRREHYSRLNNKRGPESSRFKGLRRFCKKSGYWFVAVYPDDPLYGMARKGRHGYVRYLPEHRSVMAKHLGRPLAWWEQVHHKDNDKTNNAIDNLEILDGKVHSAITALETENKRLRREIARLKKALAERHPRPGPGDRSETPTPGNLPRSQAST